MNDSVIFSRFDRIKSLVCRLIAFLVLFGAFVMIVHKLVVPLQNTRWFIDAKTNEAHVIDFFQYYQASDLARSKLDSCNVYNPETQRAWVNKLIYPLSLDKVFYNQQPPNFFPFLLPLSLLQANYAYVLWCTGQALFGLGSLYFLSSCGNLQKSNKKDRWLFLLGVLSSFPAYSLIWHGNTAFWLLGWFSLYVLFFEKKRDFLSGIALSISTFKPQYMFVMLLPALACKRWQIIFAFALTELFLLGIAGFIIGWDNVLFYPAVLKKAESYAGFIGVNPQTMICIRGFFAQFLSIEDSLHVTAALMFISLLPLFLFWRRFQNNSQNRPYLWALTICVAVLLSPHSHVFDLLLIAIPAALTLKNLSILQLTNSFISYRIWCIFILVFPLASWIANYALGFKAAPLAFFFPFLLVLSVMAYFNLRFSTNKVQE